MRKLVRLSALLALFSLWVGGAFAQRECGSQELFEQMMATDPQFVLNQQKLEIATRDFIKKGGASVVLSETGTIVYRIPLVFHVLYNTTAQNISDARLLAQLKVLNDDFQKKNTDATKTPAVYLDRVADVQIEFCLAQRDPSGNAHNGIIRKFTSKTNFASKGFRLNEDMKYDSKGGSDAWPRDSYLNFWVCDLGSSLLGFAQFPGGAAATDGVVCHTGSVGGPDAPGTFAQYGLGRTATHEVGHWLNLRHIWGDGNCATDFVDDTPFHPGSNGGCPSATQTTNCSQNPGALMMWMNYMDYTYDQCMYMFTVGQKNRMFPVLGAGGSRAALVNSLGCTPPGGVTCNPPAGLTSSNITQTSATISWTAASGASNYTAQYRTPVGSGTWNQVNASGTSLNISSLTAGSTYEWQVRTTCSGTNSAFSASAQFTTQSATVTCNPPSGLSVSSVTASSASLAWSSVSGATSYILEYKTSAASTWTTINPATSPVAVSGLVASTTYNWKVNANCSGTLSTAANGSNFTTLAAPGECTDAYEPNNTSAQAAAISVGSTISALICSATDPDWYTFSNNNQNRSVRVTLTVPSGVVYNMRLYRPNGHLAATTSGTGTIKTITYTGNPTGAYRIEVFSTSGFSTSASYTLKAEIGSSFRDDANRLIVMSSEVNMFPNPAKTELLLQFGGDWKGTAEVSMTDMLGRRVQRNRVSASGTVRVDVSPLHTGFYLVQVTNGQLSQTQKVMIKK